MKLESKRSVATRLTGIGAFLHIEVYFLKMVYFPTEKIVDIKKYCEFFVDQPDLRKANILEHLQPGVELLRPFQVSERLELQSTDHFDARIRVSGPDELSVLFWVEVKAQSTPAAVWNAAGIVHDARVHNALPLVIVPYLDPRRLADLEAQQINGVDLCGNGFINVPGRAYVQRTGNPNRFKDSRPLNNPYKGLSAMVARVLLTQPRWTSLSDLVREILSSGAELALSQASKAVSALQDDLILSKKGRTIELREPLRLLDRLGTEWRVPTFRRSQLLSASMWSRELPRLDTEPGLKWGLLGESSVGQHAMFSQGGPIRVAVSDLSKATQILDLATESIRNFAAIELLESNYPGFYFDNLVDEQGVRWASQLQTWLELQAGDARQQEAAKDIRRQILEAVKA